MAEKVQIVMEVSADLAEALKRQAMRDQLALSDWVEARLRQATSLPPAPERRPANQAGDLASDGLLGAGMAAADPAAGDGPATLVPSPFIHVSAAMAAHVQFYQVLGFAPRFGSGEGDYVLLARGDLEIALLAHPAPPGEPRIELMFNSLEPLDQLEIRLITAGIEIARPTTDEGFGRQLQVRDPDGEIIKINQVEPRLLR